MRANFLLPVLLVSAISAKGSPLELIDQLKKEVIRISVANTDRSDHLEEVRLRLNPLVDALENHFIENRPGNEAELLKGVWKSIWYDDPTIGNRIAGIQLDRNAIYQIIYDEFYYNVSSSVIKIGTKNIPVYHSYLKGLYTLVDRPIDADDVSRELNVIDLEFADNYARFGPLPKVETLYQQTLKIDEKKIKAIRIPGPKGITGRLWNAYLDQDIRIARGVQDNFHERENLYILIRVH